MRYIPILLALITWSWAGVMIKYLQERAGFDAFSQNFYRYATSALLMMVLALLLDPKGLKRAFGSWHFVVTGILGATYQTVWVWGLYYVYPAFASLISRSNILFAVLLAVAFFPDERRLAANPRFLLALLVALLGVGGVIAFHPGMRAAAVSGSALANRHELIIGSSLIVVGSGLWVAYAYGAKMMLLRAPPLSSFGAVSTMMAVWLFIVALIAQCAGGAKLEHILEVPCVALLILFGSGVLCVGIGQVLYYRSVRLIGVAFSQTITLVSPLLVGFNSYLFFGERLSLSQWASGLVLLSALGYIMWLESRLARSLAA